MTNLNATNSNEQAQRFRILMILENLCYPEDCRVLLEATALRDAGHSVTVVSPTSTKCRRYSEVIEGIQVYRYPAPLELNGVLGYALEYTYSFFMAFVISFYVLVRFGFDVIHIHMPPDLNGFLGIFYRLLGKKFVMDHHDLSPELFSAQGNKSTLLRRLLIFFERTSCRWAHRLVSTNQSQRRVQLTRGGAREEDCFVVRNGPASFFLEPHQPFAFENSAGKKVVGYVGVMGVQDGVDILVRAFAHLKNELGREDFMGVLVGSGSSIRELQELTSQHGLEQHVVFTGFVPFKDVPSYLAGMDVCVTPDPINAYNDSCTTIKTMEYMALSKPTVSFRTKENFATAGDSAVYVESESDPKLLAKAIERLIDDPDLCRRLGQSARKRIEEGLSWDHQKSELLRLYESFSDRTIQPQPSCLPDSQPKHGQQNRSDLKFAFEGEAGKVMEQHFLHDAANARLSRSFKIYYRLRPLIPRWLRQKLQKSRSVAMEDVPPDWYLPEEFIEEFTQAIRSDLQDEPESAIIHPWPQPWEMCVSLTHDVETREGLLLVDRLAKLEESFGFRSCWNIVPYKYKTDPGLIRDLTDRGHEISVHGFNHDGRLFSSKRVFEKRRVPIQRALKDFGAVGFRAPMVHRNLDWILTLGSDYDASCFDVDPFQAMAGGVGGIWPFLKKDMVELPYTLPQDHTLFIALAREDIAVWMRKLDFLRRWHGMGMLVTHPDYLNTEKRFDLYRQFLEHLKSQSGTWFPLPREIAKWWRQRSESTLLDNSTIAGPAKESGQILRLASFIEQDTGSSDDVEAVHKVER